MEKAYPGSLFLVLTLACGGTEGPVDGGRDASPMDAGRDASSEDAGSDDAGSDAGSEVDAGQDSGPDAPSCERSLLLGGMDVATQGWSTTMMAPATLSYGPDYVELATTTVGARTSGRLLLSYADAIAPGTPFQLEVVMLVSSVTPHNPLDAAAALMGSFDGAFGTPLERAQMIYLDPDGAGFADDLGVPYATPLTDGAYHTYLLSVDATGAMTLSIDGIPALMRRGFMTNGTFAIGDQTNDPNVDSTLRIRSVTLHCP